MKIFTLISLFVLINPNYVHADFKDGGDAYLIGDYESAAKEFIPLVKRGDHRAMYALGSMYAAGHGVEQNIKKSFELFSEAAKNGRADAMYKLGLMYEKGITVKQNSKKAIRYYQKSAKKGYPLSQYRFGLMYEKGLGVTQNSINAYAWLVISGHYFIYESNKETNEKDKTHINQLLLFQQQEKDKVFDDIAKHLQLIKQTLNEEDIEKVKLKVISLSKYRMKYHSKNIKTLKIESSIENLFLPETLY